MCASWLIMPSPTNDLGYCPVPVETFGTPDLRLLLGRLCRKHWFEGLLNSVHLCDCPFAATFGMASKAYCANES